MGKHQGGTHKVVMDLKAEEGKKIYKEMVPCIVCQQLFPMKLSKSYILKKVTSRFELMCTPCFDEETTRFIDSLPPEVRGLSKKRVKKKKELLV